MWIDGGIVLFILFGITKAQAPAVSSVTTIPLPPPIYPSYQVAHPATVPTGYTTTQAHSTPTHCEQHHHHHVQKPCRKSCNPAMTPGGCCDASPSNYVCYDNAHFARCVYNKWVVQACAPGTVCMGGICGYPKKARRKQCHHHHRARRH
jgi:hypothetical protein